MFFLPRFRVDPHHRKPLIELVFAPALHSFLDRLILKEIAADKLRHPECVSILLVIAQPVVMQSPVDLGSLSGFGDRRAGTERGEKRPLLNVLNLVELPERLSGR